MPRQKATFESQLQRASEFVRRHGENPRFRGGRAREEPTYRFLCSQRRQKAEGTLSPERAAALDHAIPGWAKTHRAELNESAFDRQLASLSTFVRDHGRRPRRSADRSPEERALAAFFENSHGPTRRDAIRAVVAGVPVVTPPQNQPQPFEEQLERYRQFVRDTGHVPRRRMGDLAERSLAHWAFKVRAAGTHTAELLSVPSVRRHKITDRRLAELERFLRETSRLPSSTAEDPVELSLYVWMMSALRRAPAPRVREVISRILGH